jgi:serine/threonine protein kinase
MMNLIGQSIGRYHIVEQIGEGGMAIVYKAFDTHVERDVAIKFIRHEKILSSNSDRVLKRFKREAQSLAKLSHPNILTILDYGELDGQIFLVTEYLPAGTLKQRLGAPLHWAEAAKIILPIARALEYAQGKSILHRDIKPANILISPSGIPVLADFGIAKLLEIDETTELTHTGVGIGTPEYMAPEQSQGVTADHRSDIYSLGIVLYELVTGRKPFKADTPLAVLMKHANESLPRPKNFVSDLPGNVENVILKALEKKPANRYQTMSAFADALDKLVKSSPASILTSNFSASEVSTLAKKDQRKGGTGIWGCIIAAVISLILVGGCLLMTIVALALVYLPRR